MSATSAELSSPRVETTATACPIDQFTTEEKRAVAGNVYAHVWQQAMNGELEIEASPTASRRNAARHRLLTAAPIDFLRKSDARLYRLVRELTPGNGSIERPG